MQAIIMVIVSINAPTHITVTNGAVMVVLIGDIMKSHYNKVKVSASTFQKEDGDLTEMQLYDAEHPILKR